MKKKPKSLKEFLEKEKIKSKYDEKIIVKKENKIIKLLSFFVDIISKLLKAIFYLLIVLLSSIGATYIVNNFGNFKF